MLIEALAGVALGALGAGLHLAVTRLRAGLAVAGRTGRSLALLPAGLLAIALCIWLAAQVSPLSAWTTVLGIVVVRSAVLAKVSQPSPMEKTP